MELRFSLKFLKGFEASCRVQAGYLGFLYRGATGKSDLLSCCKVILIVPFESVQGNQALSRFQGESSVL